MKDIVASIIILFSSTFKFEVPYDSNSHIFFEWILVMSNPGM